MTMLRNIANPIAISVIVPSFNQGQFIDDTIRSLLDQDYPELEILVVDGGSTDDTIERLKAWDGRIQWVSERDKGQSDAICKGFAQARHPWITWLNSDDIQTNDALWQVAWVVATCPLAEVVIGHGHYMDADGSNSRYYPTIDANADVTRELFEKGYVAQPSVFFRKDAYDRVGGINASLSFCMDYDLWVRLAVGGCRFVGCAADISGNRWYETTKTAGQLFDLLAEVAACQIRHFGKVSPYFVQAISDNLYAKLHSAHRGDRLHVLYRLLYFKCVWVWLNAHRPLYCLVGLLTQTIAKSGPIVGDKLTWADWGRGLRDLVSYLRRSVR